MTKKRLLSNLLNEFKKKEFLENSQCYNELSPRMKKVVGTILTNIDENELVKDLDKKIKEAVIKYKINVTLRLLLACHLRVSISSLIHSFLSSFVSRVSRSRLVSYRVRIQTQ